MKRKTMTYAARLLCVLTLTLTVTTAAFADEPPEPTQAAPCYPTAVSRTEDGGEIRKMYDLGPEDDPAGIPRSDFEQDGFHYILTDLLKQELPANESRPHTETVSVSSQSKDMESVLALLPAQREFITEDGLSGVLTLKLESVNVEVSYLKNHAEEFAELLAQKTTKDYEREGRNRRQRLQELIVRNKEVDRLFERIYEDVCCKG